MAWFDLIWGARIAPYGYDGTDGADSMYGTSRSERLRGLGGNDSFKGFGGADELDGGAGIDTAFYGDSTVGIAVNLATGRGYGGSAEGDTLISIENVWGSYYNDTLTGNEGANELYGLNGSDVLKGGGGADGLAGGDGDDSLKGGGGADYLEGGSGRDTVDYSTSPVSWDGYSGVYIDLEMNQAFGGDAQGDTFSGIENVTGSPYRDQLMGDGGANGLRGLDGVDYLYGGGGNDRLEGGSGDDRLDGGPGADTMIGGPGRDDFYVDNPGDVVIEVVGESSGPSGFGDVVYTTVSYALPDNSDVEVLQATDRYGAAAINLTGSAYHNSIWGTNGANVITGGGGGDWMLGFGGADTFVWRSADEAMPQADPDSAIVWYDSIFQFNRGEGDLIDLSQVDANIYAAGDQAFTFIGTAAFSGTPGEINYYYAEGDTLIQMQTGTSPDAEGVIRVLGIHTPDATWFVL